MNDRATDADADSPPEDPSAQPAGSADEIETLRRANEESREQYLRLAAELDNVRKRNAREVENARKFGIERFAQSLIPVLDSLEAGLTADKLDLDTLLEGQRATLRLFEQALTDAGISPVEPRGVPFDPSVHEAIATVPAPHAEPDSVLDVIQKGYLLNERLLRPARVIVAQTPPTGDAE
jgi:molecular chaperone GrpE